MNTVLELTDVTVRRGQSTLLDSVSWTVHEADRWVIVATQRPISFLANVEPTVAPAWRSIPSWAVLGTQDRVIPIDVQRRMAERAGAMITEVDASHVSMVSHPDVVLATIQAAVDATS